MGLLEEAESFPVALSLNIWRREPSFTSESSLPPAPWEEGPADCCLSYPFSFSVSSERWLRQNRQAWFADSCLLMARYWRLNRAWSVLIPIFYNEDVGPALKPGFQLRTKVSVISVWKWGRLFKTSCWWKRRGLITVEPSFYQTWVWFAVKFHLSRFVNNFNQKAVWS